MGQHTAISWTDHTFNPWWGCTKVSPGCAHCYAEVLDKRTSAPGGAHWGFGVDRRRTSAKNWGEPLKWNAKAERNGVRERVFCASMADVFDEEVPAEWRADLWALIRKCTWLDWQLLTKRPENIAAMLPADWGEGWDHVWMGTTTENQELAELRIPILIAVPAKLRWLSIEPLLGPVDLQIATFNGADSASGLPGIDWVIVGGESGHGARAMHPDWARLLRDQCVQADVPYFFKQWGLYDCDGNPVGKEAAGDRLDAVEWKQFPLTRALKF